MLVSLIVIVRCESTSTKEINITQKRISYILSTIYILNNQRLHVLELHSPSPLLGLILAQVEEEDAVRRRQTDVGTLAPVNAEIFRGAAAAGRAVAARFAILLGLGAAERHAGVGVPIADDGLALRQGLGQGRRRLPPVGAEQQVDRPVVEVRAGLEVPVDELADLGGPVGEAEGDGRHGQGEQVLEEEGALGRLAAAVHALQEDEGAAGGGGGGGRRGCFGTVDDHAGGLCVYMY